ncbi:High mobility group B protein 9 [Abeliophyllum distichum]|uniref:High mobility group B protein 9 n=1 Tax=Abeliophyllum distichum TaxID=126358 RepID=A0ABD1W0F2_9LAMI
MLKFLIFCFVGISTFQATGTIEVKFDCGYLISVKFGEEILSGVLYHPGNLGSSVAMQYGNAVIPYTPQLHDQNRKRRRRRRRWWWWERDPGRPKPNRRAIASSLQKSILCLNLSIQIVRGSSQR